MLNKEFLTFPSQSLLTLHTVYEMYSTLRYITEFICLHSHCVWARMDIIQEYRHLVSLGQNFYKDILWRPRGTIREQDTPSMWRTHLLWCCGCWRTWFRQVLEWMYSRHCLNHHGKCLEALFRWDLINIRSCFCECQLCFRCERYFHPLSLITNQPVRHPETMS